LSRTELEIGDPAPPFELESDEGGTVRSADFEGQSYILYFYPKDDTPGCTTQACDFRDRIEKFVEAGWTVLGVSPDGLDDHRKFREKHGLNFPLLSDPDHSVAEAYGAWGKKMLYGREIEGILRSTFLIGADGRIARIYRKVRPAGHADALLAEL
jgi:peroxiredoxin Q/BCP